MKQIIGHDQYFVTNDGKVYSVRKGKLRQLKARKHDKGYLYVALDGKNHYIHRLVAQHYIDNVNNLPVVRHLDHDKTNNCCTNLAWGTQQDNIDDNVKEFRHKHGGPVRCEGIIYNSLREASNKTGINYSTLRARIQRGMPNHEWV